MSTSRTMPLIAAVLFILMSLAMDNPAAERTKEQQNPNSWISCPGEARNTVAMEGPIQYCLIPYSITGQEWSSTLSVHNMGSTRVYYLISYLPADSSSGGDSTFSVPGFGSKTDGLAGFTGNSTLTGTMSIQIRTLNENFPFAATMVIGNDNAFQGFGFNHFFSRQTTSILIDDPMVQPLME
ncbi:MAG: hypothetical protein V1793_14755 [Pseudomonadota bacterium]